MHPANPTMSRSSVDENGETSQSEGDSSTMTIDDPLVDLMAQWEEYHHQGEQPPSDWPGDVDPGIGEALRDRIANQRQLYAVLQFDEVSRRMAHRRMSRR